MQTEMDERDYVVRYAELECNMCGKGKTVLFLLDDYDNLEVRDVSNSYQDDPYMLDIDNVGQGDVTPERYGITRIGENAWTYTKSTPDGSSAEPARPIGTLLYNIPAFPSCNSTITTGFSTQEGKVVRDSGCCVPLTAHQLWQSPKDNVKMNGAKKLLRNQSYLTCRYSGIITIVTSGTSDDRYAYVDTLLASMKLSPAQRAAVKKRLFDMETKGMVITDDFVKMVGVAEKYPASPTAGVVDAIGKGLDQIGTAYHQGKRGQEQDKDTLAIGQTVLREYDDCSSFVYDLYGPSNEKTNLTLTTLGPQDNGEDNFTTSSQISWIHENMKGENSKGIVYNGDTGKGSTGNMKPGDIVYFAPPGGKAAETDHVGVYLGNGQVLDSGDSSGMVSVRSLDQIEARDRVPVIVIRPEDMVGKKTEKPKYSHGEYNWYEE